MVQRLIKTFDLEVPLSHRMVITDYEVKNGTILIKSIDAYDTENNFIKKVDINKIDLTLYSFVYARIETPSKDNKGT